MSTEKLTLGRAIDLLINALEPLDDTSRETALIAVSRQLGISIGALVTKADSAVVPQLSTEGVSEPLRVQPELPRIDIRTLKEQKQPNSAKQMACVVAFYLKELADQAERKETVSTADLEKYFKQAGFQLPRKMPQVLIDAKASGYFESSARGEYKLNAVGYNLVAHNLPSEK